MEINSNMQINTSEDIWSKFNEISLKSSLDPTDIFRNFLSLFFIKIIDTLYDGKIGTDSSIKGQWDNLGLANEPYGHLMGTLIPMLQESTEPNIKLFFQDAHIVFDKRDYSLLERLHQLIDGIELSALSKSERYMLLGSFLDNADRKMMKDSEFTVRTPMPLRKLITEAINPQKDDLIANFACGTGSLLLEMSYYMNNEFNVDGDNLIGIDILRSQLKVSIVHSFIAGMSKAQYSRHDILKEYDNLKLENRFDKVVAIPPFGRINPRTDVSKSLGQPHNSTRSESYFVEATMRSLKDNGMGAFVVPGAFLFTTQDQALRKKLIEDYQILMIVKLPIRLFSLAIPLQLIVFKKVKSINPVLFMDLDMSRSNTKEMLVDFTRGIEIIKKYRDSNYSKEVFLNKIGSKTEKFFWFAEKDSIVKTDYRLDPYVYKEIEVEEVPPFSKLMNDFQSKMNVILSESEVLQNIIPASKDNKIINKEIVPLDDLVTGMRVGRPLPRNIDIEPGDLAWIQIGDITKSSTFMLSSGEKSVSAKFAQEHNLLVVEAGTFLLSIRGTIGAMAIAKERMCIGPNVAAISIVDNNIDAWFLLGWFLRNKQVLENATQSQSVIASLPLSVLRNVKLDIPIEINKDHFQSYRQAMLKIDYIQGLVQCKNTQIDQMINSIFNEYFQEKGE